MPKYKKKITRLMSFEELIEGFKKREEEIRQMPTIEKAYIMFIFFVGCRVTESINVTSDDITFTNDKIFVQIHRLKGSKQTDPIQIPNEGVLQWITEQKGRIFPFSRFTARRIIKKVFPDLYPHYFRLNRISWASEKFNDLVVFNLFGITATSIEHYRAKVDIADVGELLSAQMKEYVSMKRKLQKKGMI